jgi:putative NIF3 family GTP cyclohydrolase 1 type 2
MRLNDYYRLAVETAKGTDPRRGTELESELRRTARAYEKLSSEDRERYDGDALWNPYADSRVLYDDGREVNGVMWGIDITPAEVLLADRLREKGRSIDAIVGHHPRGRAQAALHRVVPIQEAMMCSWGVPVTAAECIVGPRAHEVMCASHSVNHAETVDTCRLLDIPFMCLHQPCDLLGQEFMQRLMSERAPEHLDDLLKILSEVPEYDHAIREANPPHILVGSRERRAGRVAVKFAGGTSAPQEMYELLSHSGIGTVVCMHAPESHIEEARKNHVNIVVASHMASDSLGCNLLADKFQEQGLTIIPCSGYIRVRRT